jgi:ribosomal protein S18 acetylase RimI-like enzyme
MELPMFYPKLPFRAATAGDAEELSELVNMAGDGLPLYLWSKMAEPEEDPWEVGRRRARREQGSFSYQNAVMLEHEGEVAGCLIGYKLPDKIEPMDPDMPAMFVPLQELENLAPATLYVNVLAVFPRYRGRGFGTALLGVADELATNTHADRLSIIVSDANHGARRLYRRCGYVETATCRMIKEDWDNPGQNWVLLVKNLG